MNVKTALRRAGGELKKNNVSEPEKSAEFLLRQVLGWEDKAKVIANPDYELNSGQEKKFREFIERRKKHEPVWYITGKIEFYGLDLEVNENVLIPRPETEFLVEEVLCHFSLSSRATLRSTSERVEGSLAQNDQFPIPNFQSNSNDQNLKKTTPSVIPAEAGIQSVEENDNNEKGFLRFPLRGGGRNDNVRVLELGTGSGAIILSIASEVCRLKSDIQLFASDISEEALEVAKGNAKRLGFDQYSSDSHTPGEENPTHPVSEIMNRLNIEFRQGDLFEPWADKKFDIVVANLPYIPHEEMSTLALDIHHWEPRIALDGGKEGLEIYERLLSQAGNYLNKDYMMFFEIGIDQGDKVKKIVQKYLPKAKVKIKKDYAKIDRIVIIKV